MCRVVCCPEGSAVDREMRGDGSGRSRRVCIRPVRRTGRLSAVKSGSQGPRAMVVQRDIRFLSARTLHHVRLVL
jgi:hypothetical protein